MRVVEVISYGGPEVLRIANRPEPEAGDVPGRVRVRLKAAAVHQADLRIRSGRWAAFLGELAPPFVLGFDFAGVLLDAAPGLPEGTRVAGFIPWVTEGTGEGSYAEVIRADPEWLAPIPEDMEFTTAASVPLSALAAYQAVDLLDLPEGSPVLVSGAGGVVGRFAVQHAAAAGYRVIVLAEEDDRHELLRLGAEELVPRGDPADVVAKVRAHVPEGVAAVLDAALIGAPLLPALRDGGTFVSASGEQLPDRVRDIDVTAIRPRPDAARLKAILDGVAARELTTRTADIVPLASAAEAHRRAEAGHRPGRIVLLI
ncbi:NADP-dependent oxidoreductase [Streptomyces sp. NPDC000963]|uniref:NADP-dependent oxidoreductase n=1 Tax=unclassified Streptomyces TaxID=2593676 RepID=UPI000F779FEE|nr:NADP-dependent oxidoreductase [Streptomyces sp. WAC08241]MYV64972.1 zinc-binding dehydrogenase [Streptomyces sp. SID2131]RSS43102.1 NADP-dependent oxidoreductase [Streptomyces sp. WAC08241]